MPVNATATQDESQNSVDGTALPINEIFYSLQGEGTLSGMPSVFVRTSGCNLRCWFCDSYHTSWEPTHGWVPVEDIVEEVQSYDASHVVVTGGEPLLHDEIETLLERFGDEGYHVTVETNGTIHRDTNIDLASISPKLGSSTPTPDRLPAGGDADVGSWEDKHERERLNMGDLANLIEDYDFQLKFVVTDRADVEEATTLVERLRAAAETRVENADVLLMPEGMTRKRLAETRDVTADLALEYGYRYTPRLHVDLWNDAPGT